MQQHISLPNVTLVDTACIFYFYLFTTVYMQQQTIKGCETSKSSIFYCEMFSFQNKFL